MDGGILNAMIYDGYAIAASQVGITQNIFRPTTALDPIAGTPVLSLPASFNIGGSYKAQKQADVLLWECIADGNQLQLGDFLVGEHTWNIVGMEPLMPIMALRCTDKITVQRGGKAFTQADGLANSLTTIASNLPCYVQLKRDKGFNAPAGFPAPTNSSSPMPEWLIFVGLRGVTSHGFFKEGDLILASNGQKWRVDAASSSTVVWQLVCTPYYPNA